MFSGRQQPFAWLPKAGIADAEIAGAQRFGVAIGERLASGAPIEQPMLRGLGAVRVDEKLIASERVGTRSFNVWGKLLAALGPQHSLRRRAGLIVYIVFLLSLILTVVPLTAVLKK